MRGDERGRVVPKEQTAVDQCDTSTVKSCKQDVYTTRNGCCGCPTALWREQPGMPPAQKQAEPPPARRHSAAQAVEGPRHPLGGTCSAAGITTVSIAGHSQVSSAAVQSLRAMCSPQRREDAMKRGGAGALQASEAKLRKLEQKVERMEKSHEAEASRAQSVPSGVAARHLLLLCTCSCPQVLQRGTCCCSAPALALRRCSAALAAALHLLLPSGVAARHLPQLCTCSCTRVLRRGTCCCSAPALALRCCGAALAAVLHLLLPSGVTARHLPQLCSSSCPQALRRGI